jgi:hypothetical protein
MDKFTITNITNGYLGYILGLYLSGHLKLGSQYSVGIPNKRIFSVSDNEVIIFIRFDNDVKDDLKLMFADRHVVSYFFYFFFFVPFKNKDIICYKQKKKIQIPNVSVSPVLQPKFNITEHSHLKSSEAFITPKNGTVDKQIIKLLKDAHLDNKSSSFDPNAELTKISRSCIATYNTELSFSIDNPLERQAFKNASRITPTTSNHSQLQILDTERRNVFQSKRRYRPLNLKKHTDSKGNNMKVDTNEDKLSNDIVKKGIIRKRLNSVVCSLGR